MPSLPSYSKSVLRLDPAAETDRIVSRIRLLLKDTLKRRGIVVGLSGGIDSSTTVALAARAVGPDKVLALLMPERHSESDTLRMSRLAAEAFEVPTVLEEISPILEALGCYRRYDEAMRQVIPAYGPGWKSKIVLPNVVEKNQFNLYSVVAQAPDGSQVKKRLPLQPYLDIVAATNFKQRTRKMMEYYHADRRHFAVAGTPNRLEYDQGFFVKNGDGSSDIKPIAHLYKTQVYQLAEYLGVPEEIRRRPPTTDTYSLPQGQDEFYFSLSNEKMDLCLYGKNNKIPAVDVAQAAGLTPEQVQRVFDDIDTKRSTTHYLHLPPVLIEEVEEIQTLHAAQRSLTHQYE